MPVSPDKDPYYRLRHSAAHVMAEAVLEEFPEGKIAIGPPIEDGFYYDFDLPRTLTPEDLTAIEERMRRIIKGNYPFEYREVGADAARTLFADQPYKLELIDGLAHGLDEYGETHHGDTVISTYKHDTFEDLCRGPHVERTGNIPPEGFKLLSVAGAYWRGDASKPMLQRIYGTAWNSKAELDDYLFRLEEAKRRDHRKLGKELGLFYFADDVGPGLPLFTPKGEMLRYTMESYVREAQTRYGYQHVWTGHMVKESLYHKSGHYENYSDVMFPPMEDEGVAYRLKPMNCPSHMTLFKEMGVHSYRELPLRFAEFATLYRYEPTGTLSGLTRVRSVTQDDCHVFCTPEQIQVEFSCRMPRASMCAMKKSGRWRSRRSSRRSIPTLWPTRRSKARPRSMAPRPTSWPRTRWAASGSFRRFRSISSSQRAWESSTSARMASRIRRC